MKRLTVIGYIRASTPEQRNTIVAQYEQIKSHCECYGFSLPQDVRRSVTMDNGTTVEIIGCFVDAGVSAEKVEFLCRADASEMMEYMQANGIRDIIGTKVDRVFRDVDDGRFTVRTLEKRPNPIRFHLLDVGGVAITLESAAGLFIFTMLAAVAEYEGGRKSERQVAAFDVMRKSNQKCGRQVPFGWDLAPDGKSLIPNAAEQRILARLVWGDLSLAAGRSLGDARRALNAEGAKTKMAGQTLTRAGKTWVCDGKWSEAAIISVKRNPRLAPGFEAPAPSIESLAA